MWSIVFLLFKLPSCDEQNGILLVQQVTATFQQTFLHWWGTKELRWSVIFQAHSQSSMILVGLCN